MLRFIIQLRSYLLKIKPVKIIFFVLFAFFVIGGWGCTKQERLLSDVELYNLGTGAFERSRYQKAREYFQQVEDIYPESQYLSMVRVGVANTHYEEGAYEEAIMEYQRVLEFYPVGKVSEWSQYRIGMSYVQQMLSEDRDQESTQKAYQAFEKFLSLYPKSPLTNKAQDKYHLCRNQLAGHELYIAKFYFKKKAYQATIYRLQGILTQYPDFERKDEVFYYLAKSYNQEGKADQEQEMTQLLFDKYKDSEFTQRIIKEKSDQTN